MQHLSKIQYIAACLFFASLNFEMFSPIGETFSVSKFFALLYMVVLLPSGLKSNFSTLDIRKNLLSIFLMGFFMVFSSLINMNQKFFDLSLLLNILMFWLLLNHYRRDNRIFRDGLLWFSLSAGFVGILFLLNVGVSISVTSGRITIFGDNENTVGIKMATAILFLIDYSLNYKENHLINKPWLLLLSVPMMLLMFATASRIALLILCLGLAFFVLFHRAKNVYQRVLWFLFGAGIFLVGYKLLLKQDILLSRIVSFTEEGSISQRDLIWGMYLKLIKENPVLGVGFTGGNAIALQTFGMVWSPHNVFIEVALYSGILGLLPFLYFLCKMFRGCILYTKYKICLAPLLLCVAAFGMLMSGQALNVKLFWTIAAYAVSFQIQSSELLS